MRGVILGCGYVGLALGRKLVARGHSVVGVRRSLQSEPLNSMLAAGVEPFAADLTRPEDLRRLSGPFDFVANTVSSSGGDVSVYRQVYEEGTHHVLAWLRETGCPRYAYTSSTSVYGQNDGSIVTEDSPTDPIAATAQVLVATERLLEAAAAVSATALDIGIFRAAGLYGPGRGHLYRQFRRGEARLDGEGQRWLNMIHREDLALALMHFLTGPARGAGANAGPSPPTGQVRIYNAVDLEPVRQIDFFRWLSGRLHQPLPPPGGPEPVSTRKRAGTNKRVSSERLRSELAWQPQYPTYREGYESMIREEAI